MQLTVKQVNDFQKLVLDYYKIHGRDLPWRVFDSDGQLDPYHVLVSEIMLQQTQVNRVIPKYHAFLERFPNIKTLSKAPLSEVLVLWSGLGYNRRARFLHQAAQAIDTEYAGVLPATRDDLVRLPGIGVNTASAVLVYSFNQPVVFIETNIRSIYLHHFFADQVEVSDKEILPIIEQTVAVKDPREWYWALMDYGSYLKQTNPNPSRASKHHTVQSRFEGSKRQIRGAVLRVLITAPATGAELTKIIDDERLGEVLETLENEKLIYRQGTTYHLGK